MDSFRSNNYQANNNAGNGKGGKRFSFSDRAKYVEDYDIKTVEGKNGRQRRVAVYKGIWYCVQGEKKAIGTRLILAAVCAVLACVCLVLMLLQNHVAHIWVTVVLPTGLAMFPALYLLMGVSELPFRLKPMDRAKYYHSFIRVSRSAVAMMAFTAVGEGAALVYRIKNNEWTFMRGEIVTVVCFALMLALLAGVIALLYGISIEEMGNECYTPDTK